MKVEEKAQALLQEHGIELNGKNPWDVQVHDERLYDRVLSGGSLALGESYMDGWWDADDLSEFFHRLMRKAPTPAIGMSEVALVIRSQLTNLQSAKRAFQVGEQHYDLGNDLFEKMLDPTMTYSCGYWKDAKNLEEAQVAKFDLICRKLQIRNGQKILDVGSGWGGFAKHAAERYGAHVVGITVSKEQKEFSENLARNLPVEIRLQDWRALANETFDHIVSVGMFEHVGNKNYRQFMKKVRSVLKEDGLFLLHTIGHSRTTRGVDPWFHKYIFPNGHLPSASQIANAIDGRWFTEPVFIMEDWHNFGAYYDRTLQAWFKNFDAAWTELKDKYGDRFYRMWKYYLMVSAGMFRARHIELWQIMLSPLGVEGGYVSVR